MYILILIIYIQSAQSSQPQLTRFASSPKTQMSAEDCDTAGKLLQGALLEETDPARQFAWQGYQCSKVEGVQ